MTKMRGTNTGTYVFCIVAATRPPRLRRAPRELPGMDPVRAVDIGGGLYAIVAGAPLKEYSAAAINRRLSDLEWVARAAVAHEAVIEHFTGSAAVLPMKLFTIFSNDDRVVDHMRRERRRIDALVKRVTQHDEWGVRVLLDRAKAVGVRHGNQGRTIDGASYLRRKKAQRDAAFELSSRAQIIVARLYDELKEKARLARRRAAAELPVPHGGSLLLDAAFLVPRSKGASFRARVAHRARALAPKGYAVTLSGPWPPYTFVQD